MEKHMIWNEERRELVIKGNLYNGTWFREYGNVQYALLQLKKDNIIVDMRECLFASPTPLISLLLTLKKAKIGNSCVVKIFLPNEDSYEKRKFLNYCAREGFLEIINDLTDGEDYDISKYREYNLIGIENYETILKARIINIKENINGIEEHVNELLHEINESKLNVDREQKLYVVVALRNILQELIDNVDRHAYNDDKKYYAIYIRMRYANETTIKEGDENNEYGVRTRTKPREIYVHKAIEIYFQDIGKGIVKSQAEKNKKYEKRPLREIVKEIFFRENFEGRRNNTSINGLAFLRKILKEKNNYFSVYNQFEGTGAFGVKDKQMNINNVYLLDIIDDVSNGIEGQIYNFTLFDRHNVVGDTEENYEDLLSIYQKKYEQIENPVVDMRKDSLSPLRINKESSILLFMPEYLTKNVILGKLKQVLKFSEKIENIIIADVKDEELILIEFSLNNLTIEALKENFKDTILLKEIHVITKNLKNRSFRIQGYKFNKMSMSFRELNQKYNYLFRLKVYESEEIASVLEQDETGQYILTKGIIEWTDKQKFNGFINFDMLEANDACFELLYRNLERAMALIGNHKLYAIDSTVERLVNTINCFSIPPEEKQFGIGSVFVSGMTLQSSDFKGNTLHFFCRGKGERKPALFFDPIYLYAKKIDNDFIDTYVRVGKTSRIRKKRDKSLVRNTNSYLNEKEMYKILHQYAYSSVLCGHLHFEKRHDLLSINLNAIMYDENTKLKEYINNIIRYSLCHYFGEKEFVPDYFLPFNDVCMIVYPYNHFTASILRASEYKRKYKKYIIGLTPTNITSSGEDLEYSLCFTEYISQIIKEYRQKNPGKKIKVIVFDTLSYSGKTRREIFEYINSIEKVKPYYVNIIDARVNHYPKQNDTFSYMNVNIPLLGKSETCKICLVLNKLDAFKDSVIDASVLSSIECIQSVWKVQDVRKYREIIKLANFDRIYAQNIIKHDKNNEMEEGDFYFVNALPLYIFITNRIKLENDFSIMEFVLDNYLETIKDDSMSYMLSFFLLEYGDTIYLSLLRKVCKVLLKYTKKNNPMEICQLAVIALLSLQESKSTKIVQEYIYESLEESETNIEGQLVLMYFLNKEKVQINDAKITYLYNKIKSGNNRLDLYKQFHCQIMNTNGNVHNSPLMRLEEGSENIANIRLTLASLSLMEKSLCSAELSFDILYEEGRINDRKNDQDIEISQIKEMCLSEIAAVRRMKGKKINFEDIKGKVKEIFKYCRKIHTRLFAPYKIIQNQENREIKPIENCLGDRIDYYNDHREKGKYMIMYNLASLITPSELSKNIASIYFIWNNLLAREIDYILDNVGKFVDEEKVVTINEQKYAGEVTIEVEQMFCKIKIYNNTDNSIKNIKTNAKRRYQKEVLELLGIKFDYRQNNGENSSFENNAVVTEICIPNIQKGRGN